MGNDFIFVQLTAAGAALAGGHPLSVNGRTSVQLVPGAPTRVARYEWDLMLKDVRSATGEALIETVAVPGTQQPDPAPPAAAPENQTAKETH